MSRPSSLHFASGEFYGGVRLSYSSNGIIVTHRVADREPDEVLTHTHGDAHFVLISGGDYVSIAEGYAADKFPVLVYNPPGTTHRDHFEPSGLTLDALCHELLGSMDRVAQPVDRRPPSWLDKAVELLHDRYLEDLTIAKVANGIGIHPVHLARSFRRHFRCSPGEFTRFCRLERAAGMLTRSDRSLSEIALESGFGDQSQFNKAFARDLGIAPGEYRRAAGVQRFRAGMFQNDKRCAPRMSKLREWDRASRDFARSRR